MKLLAKLGSLLFNGLAVAAILLAPAPLQTVNAGEYQGKSPYNYEDEDQDIPTHWSSSDWDVSAYASDDSVSCSGSLSYSVAHTDTIVGTGGWVYASATAEHGWHWVGSGTPSGGTLYYTYNISGSTQLSGDADGSTGATSSYAAASTDAFGWAGGPGESDYVDVEASGSCNWFTLASTSLSVSPSSAGGGTEDPQVGDFTIDAGWGVDVSDTVSIDSGTSEILLEVSASCGADMWVQAYCFDEGETASSQAYSEVYSNANFRNVSFSSN